MQVAHAIKPVVLCPLAIQQEMLSSIRAAFSIPCFTVLTLGGCGVLVKFGANPGEFYYEAEGFCVKCTFVSFGNNIMWRWMIAGSVMLVATTPLLAGFDEAVTAANDGKFAEAFSEFSTLAEQGDARAQQALAWIYHEGQGRARAYDKAAYWYRKAADQGNVTAQINLAQMYAYGKGIAQDFSQAAHWWQKLAEQGDSKSQAALAGLYFQGKGVVQDIAAAVSLWRQAAEQGIIEAQRNLGLLYGKGQGVPQDDVQAYAWLHAAAKQADKTAQKSRDYAFQQLSGAQQTEATRLAKQYVERYVTPFVEINQKPH